MFLRANKRFKDGKTHRYWSVVENRRVSGGRTVQKTLLYLGKINDNDRASWTRAIEAVDERDETRQIHLFPEGRTPNPLLKHPTLKLCLDQIELARPRQWSGCWLALELWNCRVLDDFRLAAKDTLYRCYDRLLDHRDALFSHLKKRWTGLFGTSYDILPYDFTSTYFEVDANFYSPLEPQSKKPGATPTGSSHFTFSHPESESPVVTEVTRS